jgi:hypothetical protein
MTQAAQTPDETASVVKLIAGSEIVQAAIAQKNAAETLARRGWIGQIRLLERAHERQAAKIEAEIAAAMAELKKAEAALQTATRRANAALGAKSTAS